MNGNSSSLKIVRCEANSSNTRSTSKALFRRGSGPRQKAHNKSSHEATRRGAAQTHGRLPLKSTHLTTRSSCDNSVISSTVRESEMANTASAASSAPPAGGLILATTRIGLECRGARRACVALLAAAAVLQQCISATADDPIRQNPSSNCAVRLRTVRRWRWIGLLLRTRHVGSSSATRQRSPRAQQSMAPKPRARRPALPKPAAMLSTSPPDS